MGHGLWGTLHPNAPLFIILLSLMSGNLLVKGGGGERWPSMGYFIIGDIYW